MALLPEQDANEMNLGSQDSRLKISSLKIKSGQYCVSHPQTGFLEEIPADANGHGCFDMKMKSISHEKRFTVYLLRYREDGG